MFVLNGADTQLGIYNNTTGITTKQYVCNPTVIYGYYLVNYI